MILAGVPEFPIVTPPSLFGLDPWPQGESKNASKQTAVEQLLASVGVKGEAEGHRQGL